MLQSQSHIWDLDDPKQKKEKERVEREMMIAERRLEERLIAAEKESKWLNMSLKEYAQKKLEAIDYAKVV